MNEIHLEQVIQALVFIGARVAGLLVYCPFLGSSAIPPRLKAVLALTITALLYPLHGPVQLDLGSWQWAAVGVQELVIGLVLGLAANFMMEAPMMAGQILGVQMGYSLATLFDPQTQADTPVLAEFHRLATLLIFLQLDVHHWMLRSMVSSFSYLPPGTVLAGGVALGLMRSAGAIFLAGVQFAAPGLVATILADIALGFLGKASQTLPVLFLGLSVKNLLGLALLAVVIAYWPHSLAERFQACIAGGERLLQMTH